VPLYITVIDSDGPTFEVKGGRLSDLPFEAGEVELAVVRALAQQAARYSPRRAGQESTEASLKQRRPA
jgi:hypothetical protein